MKKLNVQKLTLCGVMAALVFVMTYFPKIPVPVTGGYVHLGDGAIFLSVLLLGPLGIPAAAVGLYPPGIPLLAPGERVTREIIRQLQEAGTRERFGVEGDDLRCANV